MDLIPIWYHDRYWSKVFISTISTYDCDLEVEGLARCGSAIGFHLLWHTVELAMSTRLFIKMINLIFMFWLWCIDWVGSLYANRIFMYFCIKSSIGTQGEVS